jgi:hypothetical protein
VKLIDIVKLINVSVREYNTMLHLMY